MAGQLEPEWKHPCSERWRQQGQSVEGEPKGTVGEGKGY